MVGAVRQRARDVVRRLPADRRVKGLGGLDGRTTLSVREALRPLVPVDVTLTDGRGVRFVVTRDPVDAPVVDDLTGRRRAMWFPDEPGRDGVGLVLDVGGHHGHYVAAATEHYRRARVISLEPAARGAALVRRHAELNGVADRVEVVEAAVADAAGTGVLHHDPSGSWGSSLHEMGGQTETVRLVTLAEVLDGRRPDVVKCNAEGGEYALVPQMLELGLRPALTVLMVHPEFGDAAGLLASLDEAGFEATAVGTDHRPAYHLRPRG